MSSAARPMRYTPEEYLERERAAETKSEYLDGRSYAMAGASREHNLITLNLGAELRAALRGRPCEVYVGDQRVLVERTGMYTYPDVVVVCGEPHFEEDQLPDTLTNPTVLIEVLSPTTEGYDRGRKTAHYRQLDSLREYVLVSQDHMRVEWYTRQGHQWVLSERTQPGDSMELSSPGVAVPLREIYARVTFPPETPRGPDRQA